MPQLFPKAKFASVTGEQPMAAEPVRTGRATVFPTGDSDALVLAKRNASWAHVIDPAHPFDKRPNTWMIRQGDVAWQTFLNFWAGYVVANGQMQRVDDQYLQELT